MNYNEITKFISLVYAYLQNIFVIRFLIYLFYIIKEIKITKITIKLFKHTNKKNSLRLSRNSSW